MKIVDTNKISNSFILKLSILVIMIIIMFTMIIPFTVKASTSANNLRTNLLYLQILNYSVPSAKVSTLDPEDMVENTFSIKNSILNFLGINVNEPDVIISKEIACAKNSEVKTIQYKSNIDSYQLAANEVIKNSDDSSVAVNAVVTPTQVPKVTDGKPQILIYHTHTGESYLPGKPDNEDQTQNVCAVGDAIASELQNTYGISVVHDKTIHDEVYNNSYSRSSVTVDKYLSQYGDFKLVVDLHRDSSYDGKHPESVMINGVSAAKTMFVTAKNNPHYQKNVDVVNKLISILNKDFPGLCKGNLEYNHGIYCFNQTKSNNSVLIEVGNESNTITETKTTGKFLAKVFSEYINSNN